MASPPDSACPWLFVLAFALPMPPSRSSGLERCSTGAPCPVVSCGQKQDLSGFLVTPPIPLPYSETPAEPVFLAIADFPMLPPDPTRRRLQHLHDFEATAGLQCPLSTLHEQRCRHPCKTRFQLAGSAFAGRASNPLGHDEKFQVISILLSRTCPDASWAHARRKFYDLHQATGSPIAAEALRRIAELYAIESSIRGRSAEERRHVRYTSARPLIEMMKPWLEMELGRVPPAGPLAEAIRYALARWPALTRFLDDGRIELDNNPVERAIRPIALGRKNHLFAGSDGGGVRWATICSLIATAKLNNVEPFIWLSDVLQRMTDGHPASRLDELLPWNWQSISAKA